MADATDSPDYSAQLEKACRLYADFGYSPARIAAQLIRSGYPLLLVRARFPSLVADAFPDLARNSIARTECKATPAFNPGALLPPLIAAPPAGNLSPGVPSALTSGISFQYVPLIQCSFPHADPGDTATFT